MWLRFGILIGIILFVGCSDETALKESAKKESTKVEKEESYGIPWEKDLPTAFEKAKQEHKVVIVMAVSKGCTWCEKMKKRTLSNPKVAKRLEKYILVKADRETPSEREQLPEFRHVPIIFFMKEDREVLDNLRGYFAPEDFLEYLNDFEDD